MCGPSTKQHELETRKSARARTPVMLAISAVALVPSAALAQFSIGAFAISSGGGNSTAGTFSVTGTVGQLDAGQMSGGSFAVLGGFWNAAAVAPCYANCDGNTSAPLLSAADFVCFLGKFRSGDAYANCDGNTTPPTLSAADFVCFVGAFRAGCP
jgi:hypothetical protein